MKLKIINTLLFVLFVADIFAQIGVGLILVEKLDCKEYQELINNSFMSAKTQNRIDDSWVLVEEVKNCKTALEQYKEMESYFSKYEFKYEFLNKKDFKLRSSATVDSDTYFIKPIITFIEDGNYLEMALSFVLVDDENKLIFNEGAKRLAKRIKRQ